MLSGRRVRASYAEPVIQHRPGDHWCGGRWTKEDWSLLRLWKQSRLERSGQPCDVGQLGSDSWVRETVQEGSGSLVDVRDAAGWPMVCFPRIVLLRLLRLLL